MNVSSHPLTRYRVDLLVVVSSVLLLALPQPLYPSQSGNHPDIASVLKKYQILIPGKIQKEKVPGFAIGIVDKDGILWSDGYGFTDLSKTKRVDSHTIFSIQSISKTFTATAVLHAVQEGILDHNEPITTYLPDFTVNSRFEENPCSRMTLKLLLSHRAGFTHEAPIGNNYDASFSSFEEHVLSIQDTWLKFPVGERFSYSNLGVDLAGYILQVVSGMPFHEYVRQNIFKPMDMANSSFDTEWIKRNNNRASGHSETIPKLPFEIPIIPSGGMYSCVEDMAKYIRFHLNRGMSGGEVILTPEMLDLMYTIPFAYRGQKFGYTLGIVAAARNNSLLRNHGGGGFGFLSLMMWYPEYGFGIITLSNSTNHNLQDDIAHAVADEIITHQKGVLGISDEGPPTGFPKQDKVKSLPSKVGPDKSEWEQWVGNYRISVFGYPSGKARIEFKNGYLHFAGQQLEEYLSGLFFTAEGEALDMRGEVPTFRNIKLERMEFPLFVKILLVFITLSWFVFLVGLPVSYFRRRHHRQLAGSVPNKDFPVIYSVVGIAASLVGLGYASLLVFSAPFLLGFAIPWYSFYSVEIKIFWLLPYFWFLLCAVLAVFLFGLKRERFSTASVRILYVLLTFAAFVFLFLLIYWKQLVL